jgi:hypothetical protein
MCVAKGQFSPKKSETWGSTRMLPDSTKKGVCHAYAIEVRG